MEKYKNNKAQKGFSTTLLKWNKQENKREMPWKGEKDPYRIWLSEIILQQTRVEQGLNYYHRFIQTYPTVQKLAAAPESAVFKLWEGLGYYSRCRNLIFTAKFIATELNGKFPCSYEEIKSLKGIGPYTAAAISSFAYNLPHAVVDGNVFRVLARIFGIHKPIDSTDGKKYFTSLADQLLDQEQAGAYNQAIMDFGATVCKPANPICVTCVFKNNCVAFQKDEIAILPIKEKKIKIRKRWFYYLVLEKNSKVIIRQRTGNDIWNQLFEFPLIESDQSETIATVLTNAEKQGIISKNSYKVLSISPLFNQKLSHQTINGQFIRLDIKGKFVAKANDTWVTNKEITDYAFPKFINYYLGNPGEQVLF